MEENIVVDVDEERAGCHACEGDERICSATFRCSSCGRIKNVCWERIGETEECATCWERRTLGSEWLSEWSRNKHGMSKAKSDAIAQLALAYQAAALSATESDEEEATVNA